VSTWDQIAWVYHQPLSQMTKPDLLISVMAAWCLAKKAIYLLAHETWIDIPTNMNDNVENLNQTKHNYL
jgi:hypothetical protein